MSDNEWLLHLKPGDEVIYTHGWNGEAVGKVTRLTDTQIVFNDGSKWRKQNGYKVGGGSSYGGVQFLREPTPERLAKVHRKARRTAIVHNVGRTNFGAWSLEDLEKLQAVIDAAKGDV